MLHAVFISWLSFAFVGLSLPSLANDDTGSLYREIFEIIDKTYSSGFCEQLREKPTYDAFDRRTLKLLAWEDLVSYMVGERRSLTRELIGDVNVFSIGRNINSSFVNAANYSTRKDVQQILIKDLNNVEVGIQNQWLTQFENVAMKVVQEYKERRDKGELTSIKNNNDLERELFITSYMPLICEIYATVMDPRSTSAVEFQEYFSSVSQRSFHNSAHKLEKALQSLE